MTTLLESSPNAGKEPRVHFVDARGLKCPVPIMKIMVAMQDVKPGEELQAVADCPTFERDIRCYSERHKLTLLWVRKELAFWTCRLRN